MARASAVGETTVRTIWHQHGLQPHRVTRFKLPTDPHCVDKLRRRGGSISTRRRRPWSSAWMRRAESKPSTEPSPCCRCAPASPRAKPTTTAAMAPRVSLPPCDCSTGWCSATLAPNATPSRPVSRSDRPCDGRGPSHSRDPRQPEHAQEPAGTSVARRPSPGSTFISFRPAVRGSISSNAGLARSRASVFAAGRSGACRR